MRSLKPIAPFQSISGYCGSSAPPVILSIFFKASPMAMNSMQIPSSFSMPAGEPVKSSALRIRAARLTIFSRASSICVSIDRTRSLSNISAFFFYTFFEKRVHLFAHPHNIDMFPDLLLYIFLDVHQRKRIGGPGLDADVHIAVLPGFIPRRRTEHPD